jgi:hypothetical protein
MAEEFLFSDLLKQIEGSTGFSALPQGEYDVEVTQATAGKTGTSKSKITVRYRVLNGPHQNRNIFEDHVISPANPNAMVIFFRKMQALGLGHDYFAQNPPLEKVAKDLHGVKVRVRLGVRTWNDQERNSILATMPLGGSAVSGPAVPSAPAPARQMPPMPQAAPPLPPPAPPAAPAAAPPAPAPAPPVPAPSLPPPAAAVSPADEPQEPEAPPEPPEEPKMPKPPPGMPF